MGVPQAKMKKQNREKHDASPVKRLPSSGATHVNWLEIVNAAFEWGNLEDAGQFLRQLTDGCRDDMKVQQFFDDAELQRFWDTMRFIRAQMAAIHFNEPIDVAAIDHRVSSLQLRFTDSDDRLPLLRAGSVSGSWVPQLEQTAVLQFASYVSALSAITGDQKLKRCEGFYRPSKKIAIANDESRWRAELAELELFDQDGGPDLERCGDFFVNAKARFCSESCRTRAFQIGKQLTEPEYLAQKQKRYRERKTLA
jgi:hypothetical protein